MTIPPFLFYSETYRKVQKITLSLTITKQTHPGEETEHYLNTKSPLEHLYHKSPPKRKYHIDICVMTSFLFKNVFPK